MVVGRSVHHRTVVFVSAAEPKGHHKQSLCERYHCSSKPSGGGACAASVAGGGAMQITVVKSYYSFLRKRADKVNLDRSPSGNYKSVAFFLFEEDS